MTVNAFGIVYKHTPPPEGCKYFIVRVRMPHAILTYEWRWCKSCWQAVSHPISDTVSIMSNGVKIDAVNMEEAYFRD